MQSSGRASEPALVVGWGDGRAKATKLRTRENSSRDISRSPVTAKETGGGGAGGVTDSTGLKALQVTGCGREGVEGPASNTSAPC